MMRMILLGLTATALLSCKSNGGSRYDDILQISVVPESTALVPASRKSCTDIKEGAPDGEGSVGGDSMFFRSFRIRWVDPFRDLYVIRLKLDLEDTVLGTTSEITDTDEISNLIGIVDGRIPKAVLTSNPPAATDGLYQSDNKQNAALNCGLALGGLGAPDGIYTTVRGTLRLTGIAVDDQFREEVVNVSTPVKILVDTK